MAQRVITLLTCDLHEGDVEGTQTLAFSLEGASYEIDVCDAHAAEVRNAFAPYIGQARRANRAPAALARTARRTTSRSDVDPAAVRAWAKSKGITVNERGRIAASVVEQYRADGNL